MSFSECIFRCAGIKQPRVEGMTPQAVRYKVVEQKRKNATRLQPAFQPFSVVSMGSLTSFSRRGPGRGAGGAGGQRAEEGTLQCSTSQGRLDISCPRRVDKGLKRKSELLEAAVESSTTTAPAPAPAPASIDPDNVSATASHMRIGLPSTSAISIQCGSHLRPCHW